MAVTEWCDVRTRQIVTQYKGIPHTRSTNHSRQLVQLASEDCYGRDCSWCNGDRHTYRLYVNAKSLEFDKYGIPLGQKG